MCCILRDGRAPFNWKDSGGMDEEKEIAGVCPLLVGFARKHFGALQGEKMLSVYRSTVPLEGSG